MFRPHALILCALLAVAWPSALGAQQPVAGTQQPAAGAPQTVGGYTLAAKTQVRLGEDHLQFTGEVELEQGDSKVYADSVEFFTKEDRVIAIGNVVVTQGTNRIAADRAEFNTKTHLGTFHNATGVASVKPPKTRPQAGAGAPPPPTGQVDTDVYFFGDTVEKIGPKKYRISNGGFSTCVQPTPRWDLHADTVVLNIDHYTLLRQAILNVKGVPMLYLPFLYYPTKQDPRATGILIPTYGTSTIRGQSIHNAFFWAINRSQDATFLHDWFSTTGQGIGSEYRYNYGPGANGNMSAYFLDQKTATYDVPGGSPNVVPASTSFELKGSLNQALPAGFRARARVDYFSSLTTMQTFNTNVYDASRNQRTYGGNIVGAWGSYSLNGTFDRTEYFYDTTDSAVTGGTPRISLSRTERPLLGSQSPVYFSFTSEFAHFDNDRKSGGVDVNRNLERVDFSPQVRYPFKHWQWFTVNSSVSWRDTFYTRSDDASGAITDQTLNRRYFTAQAQAVGPVFTRVWDTPDNGYAEKFKHTIEPFFDVARTSSIENSSQIVVFDGTDTIVGGSTNLSYGLRNRFYAKRRPGENARPGQLAQAQEIITVEVRQSYYTNEAASQVDSAYQTSFSGAAPSKFSPIQVNVRAVPAATFNATASTEIDSQYYKLRTLSLRGTYNWTNRVQTDIGWSRRFTIPELGTGFTTPDHYLTAGTNAHTTDNRYGLVYSMNYDVLHSALLQERISGYYNAQCCGIAFEYQRYNFNGLGSAVPVPADHRFFLSFTLAGLGNFSPFNGAMSGVPR